MPYEHQLKKLVDGFENTSRDFATWATFLDLRVDAIGGGLSQYFDGKKHLPLPGQKKQDYPRIQDSLQKAAVLLADIGDCQEGMIKAVFDSLSLSFAHFVPNPAEKTLSAKLNRKLTESELLHLILGWQQLDLGIFKTFMRLYGLAPGDQPPTPHPGPTSDERLSAEIVSWLVVISTDANNFVTNQKFKKNTPPTPLLFPYIASIDEALANFEQQYHRLVDNYLVLLTVLPYHLFLANP